MQLSGYDKAIVGATEQNYSSTELWGEAKSQASSLAWVSPGQVRLYFSSVFVCGEKGRQRALCVQLWI